MYRYGGLDILFLHNSFAFSRDLHNANTRRTHKATTAYYAAIDFSKEKATG